MPNIYKDMLLAWADIDITNNTDSYQTILYEPIHDKPKLGNTHYTQLIKENMHLVRDIRNVGTDDFIDWAGSFKQQAIVLPNKTVARMFYTGLAKNVKDT